MTLQDFKNEHYRLKAWNISNVRGQKNIVAVLSRGNYLYVTSAPCSAALLKSAEFIIPVRIS